MTGSDWTFESMSHAQLILIDGPPKGTIRNDFKSLPLWNRGLRMATTAGERVQQVLRQGEPTERYVLATFCAWGFPVPLSGLGRTADEGLWGAGFTTGGELRDYLSEMITSSLLTWDRTGFVYLLPELVHPLQKHLSGDMREEGARRARQVITYLDEHSRYPYRPHLTNIADQYTSLGMDWSVE